LVLRSELYKYRGYKTYSEVPLKTALYNMRFIFSKEYC